MVKRYKLVNGLLHYVRNLDEHTLFSGEKEIVLASDFDAQVDAGMKLFEENEQLRRDKARDQLVLRDITARAEQLAAEVRQWRMCYNQDENKPFDWKSEVGT